MDITQPKNKHQEIEEKVKDLVEKVRRIMSKNPYEEIAKCMRYLMNKEEVK